MHGLATKKYLRISFDLPVHLHILWQMKNMITTIKLIASGVFVLVHPFAILFYWKFLS